MALTCSLSSFKYVPDALKNILFPSPVAEPSARGKRRRTRDAEDVEMLDGNALALIITKSSPPAQEVSLRPVILETPKESYLLSPSSLAEGTASPRSYEIALILETEVVEEDEPVSAEGPDKEQLETFGATSATVQATDPHPDAPPPGANTFAEDAGTAAVTTSTAPTSVESMSAPVDQPTEEMREVPDATESRPSAEAEKQKTPTPAQPTTQPTIDSGMTTPPPRSISPVHSPDNNDGPSSSPHAYQSRRPGLVGHGVDEEPLDEVSRALPPIFSVQVLQQSMTEDMFRFTPEGVYVKDSTGGKDDGAAAMETEWVIQVKAWKWVSGNWRGVVERPL